MGALALSGVTFLSTMAGGLAALRWPARREWLMALAGGIVLGAAVFDLLPEAADSARSQDLAPAVPLLAAACGFAAFVALDRLTHRHGDGHGDERPHAGGLLGAAGFVVHSFFDGLAIGVGFRVDSAVGLLVALAVIGHDFSDGLNTVSILTAARHSPERSRRWLVAVATAPFVGALVASVVPVPEVVFPLALGFFAGVFVYAAVVHLLTAARRLPAVAGAGTVASGLAIMYVIATVAR